MGDCVGWQQVDVYVVGNCVLDVVKVGIGEGDVLLVFQCFDCIDQFVMVQVVWWKGYQWYRILLEVGVVCIVYLVYCFGLVGVCGVGVLVLFDQYQVQFVVVVVVGQILVQVVGYFQFYLWVLVVEGFQQLCDVGVDEVFGYVEVDGDCYGGVGQCFVQLIVEGQYLVGMCEYGLVGVGGMNVVIGLD